MFTPESYNGIDGTRENFNDSSGDEDLDTVDYQKEASDEDDE